MMTRDNVKEAIDLYEGRHAFEYSFKITRFSKKDGEVHCNLRYTNELHPMKMLIVDDGTWLTIIIGRGNISYNVLKEGDTSGDILYLLNKFRDNMR